MPGSHSPETVLQLVLGEACGLSFCPMSPHMHNVPLDLRKNNWSKGSEKVDGQVQVDVQRTVFFFFFLAVLGLRLCARVLPSCGKQGPLFIAVRGPLTIAASLVAEHKLQTRRLSSCGSRAQSLRGMWDLPRPGLEPVSPELAGRLSTTAPPGKPKGQCL